MIDEAISELMDAPKTRPATSVKDRRRPGRPAHVSPTVVGLLRGEFDTAAPPSKQAKAESQLLAAQGVMVGVLFGALLWLAGFYLVGDIVS